MPDSQTPRFSRRAVTGLLIGGSCVAAAYAFSDTAVSVPITPDEALRRIRGKSLVLIDIRRPDEWELTGVATGAAPIDMRADDFLEQVDRLVAGNKAAPIALICARGVRSRRMAAKLKTAGYTGVVDVSEGMLGSAAGIGWIDRGLPISPYKAGVSK